MTMPEIRPTAPVALIDSREQDPIAAWTGRYQVGFQFTGDRTAGQRFAVRFLVNAACHELKRLSALHKAVA